METLPQLTFFLVTVIYVAVVFLNLVKKNSLAIFLYSIQSIAMAVLLYYLSAQVTPYFILALVATIVLKIVIAPVFFFKLIRKHRLVFAVSNYLNTPMTLVVIALLTLLAQSGPLRVLAAIDPAREGMLVISVAAILISLFLSINRKGALSQMLAILSLENSIVAFALLAGLEQSPGLELGLTFDILIWVIIASVFGSMMYRQFGSLDVTMMKKLTD